MLRQPRYTKEEHARRGTEMYERQVRCHVEATHHGRIVAIDIDSGAYEVADDTLSASERLLGRLPDAQIWCVRVGYPAVHRFGPRGDRFSVIGTVNANLEGIIRLAVADSTGQWHDLEAVIDTGFSGFVTLPLAVISSFALPWICRQLAQLADGSLQTFDVYAATIRWENHIRSIEAEAADVQPLIGMALLRDHALRMEIRSGGAVAITPLP